MKKYYIKYPRNFGNEIVHFDFEGGESEAREQLTTSDGYIYE